MPEVALKTFGNLIAEKCTFILPDYQRGYRWRAGENNKDIENSQVLQLLEDIKDYVSKKIYEDKIYCMQPIVVACNGSSEGKKENYYLIDGQQRITTLYLLYRCLCLKYKDSSNSSELDEMFDLVYDQKKEITEFLREIHTKEEDKIQSIDEEYLWNAYARIKDWTDKQSNPILIDMQACLKRKWEEAKKAIDAKDRYTHAIQFIWYELTNKETDNPEQEFQRINAGKIPLTSAELIKAYLFGRFDKAIAISKEDKEKLELEKAKDRFAKEWEEYENALQDDSFWKFISKDDKYDTRIQYFFELWLSEKQENEELCKGQNVDTPQHTFCIFKKYFEDQYSDEDIHSIKKARADLFQYFQTLRKYYNDWELHHLIGCLIHLGVSMPEIFRHIDEKKLVSENSTELRKQIYYVLSGSDNANNERNKTINKEHIEYLIRNLDYKNPGQKAKFRNVLLVMNIATILQMKQHTVFFPFDKYSTENWDLEHVCSQNEEIPPNKQDVWLKTIVDYFLGTNLVSSPETDSTPKDNIPWPNDLSNEKDSFEKIFTQNKINDFQMDKIREMILYGTQQVLQDKKTKEECFQTIFALVNYYERRTEEQPESSDGIENIALLDAGTNRSYHDAPFFVKRKYILSTEREGTYILPCTRDIFMKSFPRAAVDNMLFWDPEKDGENYKEEVIETLSAFFQVESKKTEENA